MKAKAVFLLLLALFARPAIGQIESLLVGPGDKVHVQVFDTPEFDETVRVTDAGAIPLVVGGTVRIVGLTPSEAASAVEATLRNSHIMKDPKVLVSIEEFATQNVTVSGQVVHPGSYQITTARSIDDVLTLAGGLTDMADRHVTLERASTHTLEVCFVSNDPVEADKHKKLVYPGDRISVPKTGIIYVLGDVGRPGGYPMANNDSKLTVLQAIALAGGTVPSASPNSSRLIRKTADGHENLPLALSSMQKGKVGDRQLQADDIIYVPFSYLRNSALGLTGIMASATSAAIYVKP
jgi:polysaccharide export outer membrane protein